MTDQAKTTATKAPATAKPTKTKKPLVRRDYNELGKFFAKIRIDLGITSVEWGKLISVSSLVLNRLERGDGVLTPELAVKLNQVISKQAPQYSAEFGAIVINQLGLLLVPASASKEQVQTAYDVLHGQVVKSAVEA